MWAGQEGKGASPSQLFKYATGFLPILVLNLEGEQCKFESLLLCFTVKICTFSLRGNETKGVTLKVSAKARLYYRESLGEFYFRSYYAVDSGSTLRSFPAFS